MTRTANYYAAIDDEGTVWGIGATTEDALADVRETVSGSDDETASLLDGMLVRRITERMRNHVLSGNTQFATRVLDDGTLDLDVDLRYYEISDGIVTEHCEAMSMDEAEQYAEESWSGADPGVYEIEIREYASSDAYEEGAAPLDTRNITVSV